MKSYNINKKVFGLKSKKFYFSGCGVMVADEVD